MQRVWPIFVVYGAAFVGIVAASIVAALVVHDLYPDLSPQAVLQALPGLIAGGLASSSVLALTAVVATRPLQPAALRLLPGRERGVDLIAMIVGTLALGQALDSATMLAGLGQQGTMAIIRRALQGASGPDLFNAVMVIGLMAGAAEEIFFRGYMQSRLVQRLPRGVAVLVTAVCFGVFHLDWLHGLLALILGVYLGWLTELTGSALPAVVCHVVNNALFTILTASWGAVEGLQVNVALGAAAAVVFAATVLILRTTPAAAPESAWLSSVALRVWKRLRR